ncbi:acyltransferase family protein [Rhodococcus sp. IEGM 1305]|uniref:acyltransferase family protein n=1 Tax=Rhodococcus sp. IEGM 1305 TaxID=3047092 RepID=UPI0024B658CE|nr:acyltransferase family protein [Rhodococcus sp. IEGM 1305]MDI9953032.1 acyltransferase family protein [Rhodococcus sp. IEGM 1305]
MRPNPQVAASRPSHAAAPPSAVNGYRYDLDGLRGIAIALVVVYHVWFGRVSGGVDIFLVLSGFFFTGMLVRRAGADSGPSIPAVLRRTARRLLPAFVVVSAATAVVTVIQRPFTQWSGIADQLLASLLYVQNWQLARTASDYAAADASVSPLQHLWSMSVQGQFYLVALAVVAGIAWTCRRRGRPDLLRRVLGGVLVLGLVASFAYAAVLSQDRQSWAYFDTFARLWELLAGALLALVVHRVALPRWSRTVLAVSGFAVVLGCGFLVDGAALFPGPAALIPVGAAVALILAGAGRSEQPGIVTMMASRPFVELGGLAYSLYLWHWPILIFYLTWRERPAVGALGGLAVTLVSLVLAWLTQRLIEARFQTGSARPRRALTALVAILGVAVVGTASGWHVYLVRNPETTARVGELDPWLYPGAASLTDGAFAPRTDMRPTLLEASGDLPQPTLDGCISDLSTRDVVTCVYGDLTADRTIAVVGSSHAEHWVPALDRIGQQRGIRVETYLKMGCPLTVADVPLLAGEPYPECGDWSRDVLDRLRDHRPDWVFSTSSRPNEEGAGDVTPDDYVGLWARLADFGLPFLGIRDTPWLHNDGVPYSVVDCLADGGDADSCGMPRDDVLAPDNPTLEAARDLLSVHPLDLTDAVCDVAICRAVQGNILVYHDSHHLSATYVRSLVPELDRQIGMATRWW